MRAGYRQVTQSFVFASIQISVWSRLRGGLMFILLIALLVVAFASFPSWPYSRGWGYYPSSGFGLLLLIMLIVALVNRGI